MIMNGNEGFLSGNDELDQYCLAYSKAYSYPEVIRDT